MIRSEVTIINRLGLHARAAAKLVSTSSAFASDVRIGRNGKLVDAKSIMAVMMLAAGRGSELVLEVNGRDAEAATAAIIDLINRRFDEEE